MRARGSAGGHRGIASILSSLGSSEVPRLRVGVRGQRYVKGERDLADYVLEPFSKDEHEALDDAIDRAVVSLRLWLSDGIDAAMQRANRKTSSPDSASSPD